MACAMACPCAGPKSSVRRISMSSVPCNRSIFSAALWVDILAENRPPWVECQGESCNNDDDLHPLARRSRFSGVGTTRRKHPQSRDRGTPENHNSSPEGLGSSDATELASGRRHRPIVCPTSGRRSGEKHASRATKLQDELASFENR